MLKVLLFGCAVAVISYFALSLIGDNREKRRNIVPDDPQLNGEKKRARDEDYENSTKGSQPDIKNLRPTNWK
jgi:hypothetical protein